MTYLIQLIESLGMHSPSDVEAVIYSSPPTAVYRLAELVHMVLTTEALATNNLSTYTFIPSASIRGGDFCGAQECRLRKLELLGRYAALYCDHIVFPVRSELLSDDIDQARSELAILFEAMVHLRPLLEAGILLPFVEYYPACRKHRKQIEKLSQALHEQEQLFFEEKSELLRTVYRPGSGRVRPAFEINGPREYIEHGCMFLDLLRLPRWLPKAFSIVDGKKGALITKGLAREHQIGREFFSGFAREFLFHQIYGPRFGARYITDHAGQVEFIRRLGESGAYGVEPAPASFYQMIGSVPLFASIPLREVLKLRGGDRDSFILYRDALDQVLRQAKAKSLEEAKMAYSDMVEPQLAKLRRQARALKSTERKKAIANLVAATVTLTVGMLPMLNAPLLKVLLGALAGGKLVKELSDLVLSIDGHPAEVQAHSLYFLLKLDEARN